MNKISVVTNLKFYYQFLTNFGSMLTIVVSTPLFIFPAGINIVLLIQPRLPSIDISTSSARRSWRLLLLHWLFLTDQQEEALFVQHQNPAFLCGKPDRAWFQLRFILYTILVSIVAKRSIKEILKSCLYQKNKNENMQTAKKLNKGPSNY